LSLSCSVPWVSFGDAAARLERRGTLATRCFSSWAWHEPAIPWQCGASGSMASTRAALRRLDRCCLPAGLCLFCQAQRLQGPFIRYWFAGGCSGSSDCNRCSAALWTRGKPSWGRRRRVRCTEPVVTGPYGYSGSRGMACCNRLGCNRSNFWWRVCRKRRPFS
jgi:hypothetical protein